MIIDIHAHIWKDRYEENKREILRACEEFGIRRVYVSGLGSLYPDALEIAELNLEVYGFMKEYPARIGGFCYVSPVHSDCLDVLRKGIEEYGMSGMKLWVATYCDDPRVFPLIEKCIDYDIPILVHAFHKATGQLENESVANHVANLAARYPEARIIMAHLGGNCYHGIKAVRRHVNVYADISGSTFRGDDLPYAVEQLGAERVLFGTDMHGASCLTKLGQVEEAGLSEADKSLIYHGNAEKVLKHRRVFGGME